MALKNFHKETLNDNWYEERAAPLAGVLPQDCCETNEFKSTYGREFVGAQPMERRTKPRMITAANVDRAFHQTADPKLYGGFGAVLQADPPQLPSQVQNHFETTYQHVYGGHDPAGAPHHPLRRSKPCNSMDVVQAMPAGGPGGRRVEKGKATSGVSGEVYKVNQEPQKDTHAQRSWMYSKDPMITAMEARQQQPQAQQQPPLQQEQRGHDHPSSLNFIESASVKQDHFRRQSTNIVKISKNHMGVFKDDDPNGYVDS